MTKVLMIAKAIEKTGVTGVMMSYFDNIDKEAFQVDILTSNVSETECRNHVESNGGRFYVVTNRDSNIVKYIRLVSQIIKHEHYDIVHVHGNSAMIFPELIAARFGGTKVRIAHSHNTKCNHYYIEKIVHPLFNHYYTHGLACSNKAGEWMFKKRPFLVINNGIDAHKFTFRMSDRISARAELNLTNKVVIGHIGYFNYQKNHERLVLIFKKIKQRCSNVKLLLVGDGSGLKQINELVKKNSLENDVIFYGASNHIPWLLSAMDVFALPSQFEGLGIVLIEAQAAGLQCVASTAVPSEANVAGNVTYCDLNDENDSWVSVILDSITDENERANRSKDSIKNIEQKGYNIKDAVQVLQKFYIDALRK